MTPTSVGVGLPSDAGLLADFAISAERIGFDSAWSQDSIGTANSSLDGLHMLSYVSALTDRRRLGISVIYAPRRNPVVLTRDLASIDRLSEGRLVVGLGTGNAYHRPTLAAVGIAIDRPVRRLVETIDILRALWNGGPADHHGQVYSFDGIATQPTGVQQPGPPILLGARAERALHRAARIADGWSAAAPVATEDFFAHLRTITEELQRNGRDRSTFTVSKNVYIAVERDKATARERLAAQFHRMFGRNPVYDPAGMAERVGIFGTVAECAAALHRLHEAGVDEIVLHPLYDHLHQLDRVAEATRAAELS